MNLNEREFKEFRIIDLFDIKRGSISSLNEIDEGKTPIVSASGENEGIAFYGDIPARFSNNITISMNGVNTGFTAYHNYGFDINVDCCVLIQKFDMNAYIGEFLATIIGLNRYKYSYGRKMSAERIEAETIKLPVSDDGNPDWKFMEDYIKALHHKPISTKNKSNQSPTLNIEEWAEFKVGDIFPKKRIRHYSAMPETEGETPFVSSTSVNNGIASYVDEIGTEGNCITVSTNGDGFDCFYQPQSIVLSNDAEALYNDNLNKYNALFIASVMNLEKIKYGYGRKPKNDKVYETIIKLPVSDDGNPDWKFMEDYIKALPYGDKI